MRTDIVHIGAGELTYEIRNIVSVGEKLQELGISTYWENIGDPVAKGEKIPAWIDGLVWAGTFFLVWMALAQIGLFAQGVDLLRSVREPDGEVA